MTHAPECTRATRWFHPLRAATLAVALHASSAIAQTPDTGPYRVTRAITLGGDGRWDYVTIDSANHRLFIARQTRVMVVDPDSGKLLGEIPRLDGAHGVALAYPTGHGFATSGHDGSVVMFDLRTLRVVRRIHADDDADAILYDPASRRVVSFNGDANTASVIQPDSGRLLATIPLGGEPEFGVAAGDGRLYANIVDSAQVVEIDPTAGRVVRRWPLAPCEEPTGLAIDRVHHLLFSGCRNKLMAISNYQAGRLVGQVPIGGGVDGDAFDPATQLAFSSNGEGTITVVHEDSPTRFQVVGTVATRRGARTMALDERTHRIYTVTAAFGPTPAATAAEPRPRPSLVPGTFALLVLER
jgi:DNA-binding beta-propeller fold protein YncE